MDLKLFSAEFVADHIQLTYTDDGQAPTQTGSMMVLRAPTQGSFNTSLNHHQLNILEQLNEWNEREYKRVKIAMKKAPPVRARPRDELR